MNATGATFSEPHEVAGEAGDLVASENVEFFGAF